MAAYLTQSDFNTVVRLAPLISIDLIVRDPDNRVFLGLRNNEPARDYFFVPGGIILKNEPLAAAFTRIARREIGYPGAIEEAMLLGIYDHFYETNAAGEPGYGTRYVVLAHEIRPRDPSTLSVDSQHREFGWWTEAQILASDRVHHHTKAYFATR